MTYDILGQGYTTKRRADPVWQAAITAGLAGMATVANIGAGAGSYEPASTVIAVEPSAVMIGQRAALAAPAVMAVAEQLPLGTSSVDACLAVLTVHHWADPLRGLREMMRVSRRRIAVVTWDQDVLDRFWLHRYFPAAAQLDRRRWIDLETIASQLGQVSVVPLPVPKDCADGFAAAYWARPQAYLDPEVRRSISSLAQLPVEAVEPGLAQLAADLATGVWETEHGSATSDGALDAGYRLVMIEH